MTSNFSLNNNLFQPTGFQVVIDRQNYANLSFFVQTVNHPGAINQAVEVPFRNFQSAPMPGGQLQFGELTMEVLLDEDFNTYNELYDWLWRLATVRQIEKRDSWTDHRSDTPSHADIIVTALTNQNNRNRRIKYHDCIPTSLGDIQFQATNQTVEFITFPANFRFTYFEID